jgi:hypothetical protein
VVKNLRNHLFLLSFLSLAACGLEPLVSQPLMGEDIPDLPRAQPNVLSGRVAGMSGAALTLWSSQGSQLEAYTAVVGGDGEWSITLPGNSDFSGLRAVATLGQRSVWGLLPPIVKQGSVLDPERHIDLGQAIPGMGTLNARSTTLSLVLTRLSGGAALPAAALKKGADRIIEQLDADNPTFTTLHDMVGRLLEAAPVGAAGPLPWHLAWSGAPGLSPLDTAFLDSEAVDYDADGAVDGNTAAFDAALDAAANDPTLKEGVDNAVCYAKTAVRTVFLVDLNTGTLDLNCKPVDTFNWATQEPGKTVFFTGGVHETTPQCDAVRTTSCVSKDVVDATNQLLGNWTPNKVVMYDDGTHGDAVAGDNIWTLTLALPTIDTAASPDGRGVRIGYKYTYGKSSQGWTGTEEWPGNQRLLEVKDENGDHLVVRYDVFGDETANKDKANLLTPASGGCGVNKWEADISEGCAHDTRENLVDTDLDCVPDTPPAPGTASPLLCQEAEELGY